MVRVSDCRLTAGSPLTSPFERRPWLWWLALTGLWVLSTAADRLWLALDQRLPAWDQADYLNSAVDHGRALGLLAGGGWPGWDGLLDLSPKIPPLASLVNGTVMAISGQAPDQASWALALWHGLLLLVVACWGRQLQGRSFGLLAAALLAVAPALASLRVDYTLDLPVSAASVLALWLLGRWQAPRGGGWCQALAAALAVTAAILVKQSALLVLVPPCLWAAGRGLGQRGRRLQVLAALARVLALVLPWLHHNWITTLGGTERAVVESGAAEGDPTGLGLASLLWYPRLWGSQLGPLSVAVGLGGLALAAWRCHHRLPSLLRQPLRALPPGWPWLLGCGLSGWLFTSLSPNKDPRYIAPVLPLLVLILAWGWRELAIWLQPRLGRPASAGLLGLGLLGATGFTAQQQAQAIQRSAGSPAAEVMASLRQRLGQRPGTVMLVANSADLNEHTLTSFGRLEGASVLARRLGQRPQDHEPVLAQSQWLLLATGDQGTRRAAARQLSRRVRSDGRFQLVQRWPWSQGRQVELWQRRPQAGSAQTFDAPFIALSRGLERGVVGLPPLFAAIGPQHQLDPHFLYQGRVDQWARRRLSQRADDRDALWSLALLEVLRNRPTSAAQWFSRLERAEPSNPWPGAYRSVVLLADWRACAAGRGLETPTTQPSAAAIRQALGDLSRGLCGQPQALGQLRQSLPAAIAAVKSQIR